MDTLPADQKAATSNLGESTPTNQVNVGEMERLVSGVLGGIVILGSLSKGSLFRFAAVALGAGLLHRGITGHCHTYEALELDTSESYE